ncbi:helix-turn-helix transcriptional regulator [Martelella limonii]|uniref:helix-turn-helix transcriptional regulator n=1 Tax=Martelella limonii TaxID=1647649 RepID=UPI0015805F1C|nr:helix-turn-helix transcriptional regulator [Martelella limonii]
MTSVGLIDPECAAALLDARDPGVFSGRLLEAAYGVAGVEELYAYRTESGPPRMLASSGERGDARERAAAHARRFHKSDPALAALQATAPGSGFLRRFPAESIALAAYRDLCFERPRFSEKICFGWRFDDHAIVVTFYHRSRPQADIDMVALGALAQLAITGLTRLARRERAPLSLAAEFESRLANSFPVLSGRERQICARTMAGETAQEIATELGVGHATVLTYRQRAYQKLGFSKASDLLSAVVN